MASAEVASAAAPAPPPPAADLAQPLPVGNYKVRAAGRARRARRDRRRVGAASARGAGLGGERARRAVMARGCLGSDCLRARRRPTLEPRQPALDRPRRVARRAAGARPRALPAGTSGRLHVEALTRVPLPRTRTPRSLARARAPALIRACTTAVAAFIRAPLRRRRRVVCPPRRLPAAPPPPRGCCAARVLPRSRSLVMLPRCHLVTP